METSNGANYRSLAVLGMTRRIARLQESEVPESEVPGTCLTPLALPGTDRISSRRDEDTILFIRICGLQEIQIDPNDSRIRARTHKLIALILAFHVFLSFNS